LAAPAVHLPMVGKAQAEATVAGGAAGAAAGAAYGAANGPALVPKMAAAAAELAALVRTQIVAKGATHVVLVNLPDLALTPSSKVQSASSQQLIAGMVSGFNIALRVGIDGLEDKVLYVDLATASQDQIANPAKYGISNATTPACGATVFGTSSLFCTGRSLINNNTGTYLFADDVHLAPFGQSLIAKQVAEAMVGKGWL
jgi:phospholipase/lecithinase/hemolysin